MTTDTIDFVDGPYTGNGVQTVFAINSKVQQREDIKLTRLTAGNIEVPLDIDVDYDVTLNANQDSNPGGSVTYPHPSSSLPVLPSTESITVDNAPDFLQKADLKQGGEYNPQVVEDALDKIVIMVNKVREVTDRCVKISITDDSGSPTQLPAASDRANKVLLFDGTGLLTVGTPTTQVIAAGNPADTDTVRDKMFSNKDMNSVFLTTKGDLRVFTTENTRLPVGTAGQILTPAPSEASGLIWDNRDRPEIKTSAFTVVAADQGKLFLLDRIGLGFTVTLPTAASVGAGYRIGFKVVSTGPYTLDAGTDTFDNAPGAQNTRVISCRDESIWIVSDGTSEWKVVEQSQNRQISSCKASVFPLDQTGIVSGVYTKVNFEVDGTCGPGVFDDGNNRFTPNVGGEYLVTARASWVGTTAGNLLRIAIYLNGSIYRENLLVTHDTSGGQGPTISAWVRLVFTNDFVEIYAQQNSGVNQSIDADSVRTWFTVGDNFSI